MWTTVCVYTLRKHNTKKDPNQTSKVETTMTEMKTTLDRTNNGCLAITAENISEQEHKVIKMKGEQKIMTGK